MGTSQSHEEESSFGSDSQEEDEDDVLMSEREAKEEIRLHKERVAFAIKIVQMAVFMIGSFIGHGILTRLVERKK